MCVFVVTVGHTAVEVAVKRGNGKGQSSRERAQIDLSGLQHPHMLHPLIQCPSRGERRKAAWLGTGRAAQERVLASGRIEIEAA